jgi:hypothetical protein
MGRTHEELKKEKEKKPRVCIFDYSERERKKSGGPRRTNDLHIIFSPSPSGVEEKKKLMNKLNTTQLLLLIRCLK